eukprot:SAG11_NODE_15801_length_566_cov_0.659529_1_plen_39_part_01
MLLQPVPVVTACSSKFIHYGVRYGTAVQLYLNLGTAVPT